MNRHLLFILVIRSDFSHLIEMHPRLVVTNGMVIPNYSSQDHWEKFNALGVSQYGQMTAGSYMYIGPQGIVHGTTITLLNAARMKQGRGKAEKAIICFFRARRNVRSST